MVGGRKTYTTRPYKDVHEKAKSYNQNIPGTTTLEHASTVERCTESAAMP